MAQKWEYCVVGPIKNSVEWEGQFPKQMFLTSEGVTELIVKGVRSMNERHMLAKTISDMGDEGWEMVSTGAVNMTYTAHFLYFKRPKP
jgi:hypothetical protein